MISRITHLDNFCLDTAKALLQVEPISTGEWQSQVITNPDRDMRELFHQSFIMAIPGDIDQLVELVNPNLPWAEDHFQERVSGEPLNPPPSEQWWPFAQRGNAEHKSGEKFSHTYPERMWPRFAGVDTEDWGGVLAPMSINQGIRFEYGDLQDVVNLLKKNPLTRQAYLPIWFPEDTGAVHGERVPCTLGYHFMIRNDRLTVTYYIRSCDFMRHFRDDVFMAARLAQWVAEEIRTAYHEPAGANIGVGDLVMHIANLHAFRGDDWALHQQVQELTEAKNRRWASYF